jgi:hypothetical protein
MSSQLYHNIKYKKNQSIITFSLSYSSLFTDAHERVQMQYQNNDLKVKTHSTKSPFFFQYIYILHFLVLRGSVGV